MFDSGADLPSWKGGWLNRLVASPRFQNWAAWFPLNALHRLTNRFLALLHQGVEPERILATTFTRKAAGEILDRAPTA